MQSHRHGGTESGRQLLQNRGARLAMAFSHACRLRGLLSVAGLVLQRECGRETRARKDEQHGQPVTRTDL